MSIDIASAVSTSGMNLSLDEEDVVVDVHNQRLPRELKDLFTQYPVIQVKGWGSGVMPQDYKEFGVSDPNESLEEFTNQTAKKVEGHIFEFLEYTRAQGVVVQWDGDKITNDDGKFETFGVFLYGVLRACKNLERMLNLKTIRVICTKLTSREKAPRWAAEKWKAIGAEALCNNFDVTGYSVAFPYEKDAAFKDVQKRTGYGYFGSAVNKMIPNKKLILAFGGGEVLTMENKVGYAKNTDIRAWDIRRKNGSEQSQFVAKINRD